MVRVLSVATLVAVLLSFGTVVTVNGVALQERRAAIERYTLAAEAAEAAEVAAQTADDELAAARDTATTLLADADAVIASGSGLLDAGALAGVGPAADALRELLAVEPQSGEARPGGDPSTTVEFTTSAGELERWAADRESLTDAQRERADEIVVATEALRVALATAVRTVTAQAAGFLGTVPLADAASRAAVDAAAAALIAALEKGDPVAGVLTAYQASMTAARASQTAAEEEAATESVNSARRPLNWVPPYPMIIGFDCDEYGSNCVPIYE
jgi:hypothetical protein